MVLRIVAEMARAFYRPAQYAAIRLLFIYLFPEQATLFANIPEQERPPNTFASRLFYANICIRICGSMRAATE
jgi:hypothetical protein